MIEVEITAIEKIQGKEIENREGTVILFQSTISTQQNPRQGIAYPRMI